LNDGIGKNNKKLKKKKEKRREVENPKDKRSSC
jgi:hypothetical protein